MTAPDTAPLPAPGDTFQRQYTVFAELAEVYRTYLADDRDIPHAAERAATALRTFSIDEELLITLAARYVRTGGAR